MDFGNSVNWVIKKTFLLKFLCFHCYYFLKECNGYGFIGGIFGFVSIATMVMISAERYLAVKYPFRDANEYKKYIIRNNKKILIKFIISFYIFQLYFS